jgi:hypothetical protein
VIRWAIVLCLVLAAQHSDARSLLGGRGVVGPAVVANGEEFVGPFASWMDVTKTASTGGCTGNTSSGAVGDGSTDDTTAIQNCLNAISSSTPVVYFPAPSNFYKVTKTLAIVNKLYAGVIGADPTTTKIIWGGVSSGTTVGTFTGTISAPVANSSGFFDATLTVSGLSGVVGLGQVASGSCLPAATTITNNVSAGVYNITGASPFSAGSCGMTTVWHSLLYANGINESEIDRLTLDGASTVDTIIDQSWDGLTNFDEGNQYADVVLQNSQTAFACGSQGGGCADIYIIRDKFLNNAQRGIWMRNANALSMTVWYSLFQNNGASLTNESGSGNWHVYNNNFVGSTIADMAYFTNVGTYSAHNNYSVGSNYFFYGGGFGSPNNVTLSNNVVLDVASAGVSYVIGGRGSVYAADYGPLAFIDNTVRSASGATAPVVSGANILAVGNTFTLSSPLTNLTAGTRTHEFTSTGTSLDDVVVSRSTVLPTCVSPTWTCLPTLPVTPPNNHRTIFETTPSASGSAPCNPTPCSLQTAITAAAAAEASGTVHPVVHVAPGTYNVTSTITVPATVNSGIQIIGDGYTSHLSASGGLSGPVLQLQGSGGNVSKVILKGFYVSGGGVVDGIEVDNADQPGSIVYMEQPFAEQSNINILVDSLDYTQVEIHNLLTILSNSTGQPSFKVIGGTLAASGSWQGGATKVFADLSSVNDADFGISNGAHLLALDFWHANGSPYTSALVTGTGPGALTIFGPNAYQNQDGHDAVDLNNFTGTATISMYTNGFTNITGSSSAANVLGVGISAVCSNGGSNGTCITAPIFTNSGGATTEFLTSQIGQATPTQLAETGCCDTTFLVNALQQLRSSLPTIPVGTAAGVTDVRFNRVFTSNALTGIHLKK